MSGKEKFELTDEGNIDKCLGIDIRKHKNGTCDLKQPFLIERIIKEINIDDVMTQKRPTPVTKDFLHKDLNVKPRINPWNYHSIIGMLSCLQGT